MPQAPLMEKSIPEPAWYRQRIRAPREDGALLSNPPLGDATSMADRNHELLSQCVRSIQGRSLTALREWSRREAIRAAHAYVSQWCNPGEIDTTPERLFVSGHQPTLYHPGVWIKNFAVGDLARRERSLALNLIVDNDLLATTAIRVPAGSPDHPHVVSVPFDTLRAPQPWEEARLLDRESFSSFPERVLAPLSGWSFDSILPEFWKTALQQSQRNDRLVDCVTAARNQWERNWGLQNLELPLSQLCELESFLWFASHLLAQLPRLHAVYNQVLREYRAVNRIRSRNHPVPDLREHEGWLEAPFWVWRPGQNERQRVFACQSGREVLLSDGKTVFARLPLTADSDACCAVKVLQQLPEQGIRFRTRALTTTLFSRLCLADLFVHGIGGAKYDEITDRIIARFFGIAPPGFLMLSGTLQLPLGAHPVQGADEIRLKRQLRELEYNSDRHLEQTSAEALALAEEKQRLIHAPTGGYARYKRLQEINSELMQFTRGARSLIQDELQRTSMLLRANAVLRAREYAFCLFPPEKLRELVQEVERALATRS